MLKEKEYILFDLDGTIINSEKGIINSAIYALESFGIKIENPEMLRSFIGPPLKDSIIAYFDLDSQKAEEIVLKYREHYGEKGLYECALYPGIKELLEDLTKAGKRPCIATTKSTYFAEKILSYLDVGQYFTKIAGSNLDGSRQDKHEVIEYCLKSLAIEDRKKVLMIGDRKYDIEGAKKSEIDSIAVSYGFGELSELKKAGAKMIVKDARELRKIIL